MVYIINKGGCTIQTLASVCESGTTDRPPIYCCIVQMVSACDLESQDDSSILFAAVKNKERR